ncbi:MAG: NAD(P)/FAD-dependent oxidoreductase [Byssovorax sp.]
MSQPDVVVIGAGLGGLAAAAHLATRGVAVTVLEAHDRPGGYATTFERGGLTFEVGLHLLDAVGPGQPGRRVLDALGIGDLDLDLLSPPHLRREIWPDLDLRIPQGLGPYLDLLGAHFPAERPGLARLAALSQGLHAESTALDSPLPRGAIAASGSLGPLSPLARSTAGAVVDAHIVDRRLRAHLDLFASGWLGLPLDRLSAIQWLIPWYSYHALGGSYPRGGSQALSRGLAAVVERAGGCVRLSTPARRIQIRRGRVTGVELETGELLETRAVVSNVSPQQTFGLLLDPSTVETRYLARLARMEPSVSCFKVWLGLDSPVDEPLEYDTYLAPSYEPRREGEFDPAGTALSVVVPTRLSPDLAPGSRAIVSMSMLVETATFAAAEAAQPGLRTTAADILIDRIERALLPGLRGRITAREIATPATFERFTRNPGGSVYGWAARVDQCGAARLDHATPIDGLHLAGAWTRPGGGFTSALRSGLRAARDVFARLPR